MKNREEINKEVKEDLKKPIEQLLTDIHEEYLNEKRGIDENLIHAQKRFASLIARNEISNGKLNKRMLVLTIVMALLAFVQVLTLLFN